MYCADNESEMLIQKTEMCCITIYLKSIILPAAMIKCQWAYINYLPFFKSCVLYIFNSLFFVSKRKHLWNKEECFLFHLESSFRSWNNQILTFQIFKCQTSWNAQAWNTKHIWLNNLGSKHSLVMKFGLFI